VLARHFDLRGNNNNNSIWCSVAVLGSKKECRKWEVIVKEKNVSSRSDGRQNFPQQQVMAEDVLEWFGTKFSGCGWFFETKQDW
jgi:hypothetical protein